VGQVALWGERDGDIHWAFQIMFDVIALICALGTSAAGLRAAIRSCGREDRQSLLFGVRAREM
jgi:hypothetical protein